MPRITVDHSGCGGAGECIEACKFGAWGWADVEVRGKKRRLPAPLHQEMSVFGAPNTSQTCPKDMRKCVGCRACEAVCPMKIIKVED